MANPSKEIYSNVTFVYDPGTSEFIHIDAAFPGFGQVDLHEITPGSLLALAHPDDRSFLEDKLQELLDGSLKGSFEFRMLPGNHIRWVRLTPFLLTSDAGHLIAGNLTDITSEWNNFDSVRRYANKKNSILNMLAHDLRGPLDIANTLTRSLDKKVDDPGLLKMTRSISGILTQSIQMIADLIDRELLETVEVELAMKRLDIVMKMAEYIEECRRSEPATERTFNLSSSQQRIYLNVDEAKFMQIVNNLMTNALKFTHPGGIISVDITDKEHSVLFAFSDNGIGIPEAFHAGLFDKFTKARRRGLNGEPTIGLGLSIVKLIVEWHKGRIWFESKENAGTTFYFEIPKEVNAG